MGSGIIQITENAFYIPGAVNIGVVKIDNGIILVDTGLDREAGRRILKALEKGNVVDATNTVKEVREVKAIINTHSHADHFGGNGYIVKRTTAKVYAPEIEAGIIQYPYIEPLYLFSAHPVKKLLNRFLMAEATKVDFVVSRAELRLGPLRAIPLYGHSPRQIGVEVDGVLYCADSIFSKEVIEKYKIPLFMDIEKQKETLSFLEKSNYEFYVPCHAKPTADVSELVDLNFGVIERVEEFLISESGTTDEMLRKLCRKFEIRLRDFTSYALMLATLKAYLSYLHDKGALKAEFSDTLYWKS
jgi:glyoxylase-like metal-dependent hydrolase (beta-lactamase superfamily II)